MKRGNILGAACGLGLLSFAGLASAQEGAPPAAATPAGDGHASGLMVQGRMQVLEAVTDSETDLGTQREVKVTSIASGSLLVVA